jgi:hypothetical protein
MVGIVRPSPCSATMTMVTSMLSSGLALLCIVAMIGIVVEDCEGLTVSTVDHFPPHKRRMVCRKDLIYGAVLQRKKRMRRHRPLTPLRPANLRL